MEESDLVYPGDSIGPIRNLALRVKLSSSGITPKSSGKQLCIKGLEVYHLGVPSKFLY